MEVKIKICGVRTLEAAQTAIEAGAEYIGFIFVPNTKRYINPQDAKEIMNALREKAQFVGVFKDAPIEEVNTIVNDLQLDCVELEGKEDPHYCSRIKTKVMKGIAVDNTKSVEALRDEMKQYNVTYILLDRKQQGYGPVVDFSLAKAVAEKQDVFLAGGLTPENVAEAVESVHPFAVDVSSGIETDGKQDLEKIKAFIKSAKSA